MNVVERPAEREREKYADIWEFSEYRKFSPGLENVDRFMRVVRPPDGSSIIDIGCGTGCAGLKLAEHGLDVWYLDIADGQLDPRVDRARFFRQPVWHDFGGFANAWDFGFCCDVLEHIPPEYTMLVVDKIVEHCRLAWLQVCFKPDDMGRLIGQPLHLTVQPYQWWLSRLSSICDVMDARDLCGDGVFLVGRQRGATQ